MHQVLQRLKERKLVQWGFAYLAGAFVVLQLMDALEGPIGLSQGVQQILLTLITVGCPITLVLAWYHGEQGRQRVSGPELVIIACLLGLGAIGLWVVTGRSVSAAPGSSAGTALSTVAFVQPVPERDLMVNTYSSYLAVSPNGHSIVVAGARGLLIRDLSEPGLRLIEGTVGAVDPVFSPDGTSVAFRSGGALYTIGAGGGPQTLIAQGVGGRGLDWAGGWIYAGSVRVRLSDGTIESLPLRGHWPQVLPGGEELLLTEIGPSGEGQALMIYRIDGDGEWLVRRDVSFGRYAAGHMLLVQPSGTVLALPYDLESHTDAGPGRSLLANVRINSWGSGTQLAAGGNTLAYVDGGRVGNGRLRLVTRYGDQTAVGEPANYAGQPQVSPLEAKYAVTIRGGNDDVWVNEFASPSRSQISDSPGEDERPVFSPDGAYIAWSASRPEGRVILRRRADAGGPETILHQTDMHVHLNQWTPHGNALIWAEGSVIWALELDSDSGPRAIVSTDRPATEPTVSPDGRWLAYAAEVDGLPQIHLTGYLEGRGPTQITSRGGSSPRWSADGRALFFLARDTLWAADVDPSGRVTQIDSNPILPARGATGYDVVDGERFLLLEENPSALMSEINVITGWSAAVLQAGR